MYAVIATGGKQYRVEPGQRLEVELLGAEPETEVSLRPVMLVDGDTVVAGADPTAGATPTNRESLVQVGQHRLVDGEAPPVAGLTRVAD